MSVEYCVHDYPLNSNCPGCRADFAERALRHCASAISDFLESVNVGGDNYVGGPERLKLEAALAIARKTLP